VDGRVLTGTVIDPAALRALWDFSDPAGSERRFRERRSASADPQEAAVLTTQVARALGLQEQYAEAHAELDALTSAEGEVGTRAALERGRLLRDAGDPVAAATCFTRARVLADEGGRPGLGLDALHMLALLPEAPAEQERLTREALDVARASADPEAKRWVAPLLNNQGMVLHDAGDLAAALETFEEAVRVRNAQGDAAETAIARWMVGWTLRLLGRADEALALQQELARTNEEVGRPDPYVHDELALLHAERGEPDLAAHHERKAARLRRVSADRSRG